LGRLLFARPFLTRIQFYQALLAEGGLPEDPAAYVKRVNALLV
jgi:molecular chaperone HtpG